MFINFSNHPSERWGTKQLEAAKQYGEIVDIAFPYIDPQYTSEEVKNIAEVYADKIISLNPRCVLCQGEFCVSYHVINRLKQEKIQVVAACSERKAEEIKLGDELKKTSRFYFIQFREY